MYKFEVYIIPSIKRDINPMEFVFIIHTIFYSAHLFHFFSHVFNLH